MFKAIENLRNGKGFTLIELLIVVAIIGILAAIAIPGYIGMQDRSRRGAIQRTATASEPELQGWMTAAKKKGTQQGSLVEVDTDWNGVVDANADDENYALANYGVVKRFVESRNAAGEASPWGGDLWKDSCPPGAGQICLAQAGLAANISTITMSVYDSKNKLLYSKVISAD